MPYRPRPPRPTSSKRLAMLAMTCRRVRPTASMTSSTSLGRTCDHAPTLGRPDITSSANDRRVHVAHPVFDGLDGAPQVGLDRQAETLRDRRDHFVGIDKGGTPSLAAKRVGERD